MLSNSNVIEVKNLSKQYCLFDKPQDRIKAMLRPRLNWLLGDSKNIYGQSITALSSVSFSLKKGSTLGVIGTNGSGKSTLLQLLCGTLTPSTGSVVVNGRIAALLELGSGFNVEFTGRENIHLNAAILGLTDDEIEARIDKIIDFADIGGYIEQPVKTYSSGMFVRLAFAIIAHVDADVLVIDEALAVGDAIFTQKCMRYIREFKKNGTLIFVSHDTASVQNLCDQCLWLSQGKLMALGNARTVVEQYLQYSLQAIYGEEANLKSKNSHSTDQIAVDYKSEYQVYYQQDDSQGWETGNGEIVDIKFTHSNGAVPSVFLGGERVKLSISAKSYQANPAPIIGFLFKDRLGQVLFGENTLPAIVEGNSAMQPGDIAKAEFVFSLPMLPNGDYAVSISFAEGDMESNIQHQFLHEAIIVKVSSSQVRWGLVGVRFEAVNLKVENE